MTFLSRRLPLALIRIPRTGGTSILTVLAEHENQTDPDIHVRARDLRDLEGADFWASLPSIAVVRNPVDWFLSNWLYIRQHPLHPLHAEAAGRSVAEFARLACHIAPPGWRQVDFLTDRDGKLLVRHVLRFERLTEEWESVARTLGLPEVLPRVNESERHLEDGEPIDPESRRMIARIFAEDSFRLGYPPDDDLAGEVRDRWGRMAAIGRGRWLDHRSATLAMAELLIELGELELAGFLRERAGSLEPDDLPPIRRRALPAPMGPRRVQPKDALAALDRIIDGTAASPLLTPSRLEPVA
jgi:hypothetical protein